jgi:TRAP-type C4-dicarboxylate transport system permease small subunit
MASILDQTNLNSAATAGGLPQGASVQQIIGFGINFLLGVLGVIFFVLIVVGGVQWMTSGGDESTIKAAKHRISSAVVGLAVVLAALAITTFVLRTLAQSTGTF